MLKALFKTLLLAATLALAPLPALANEPLVLAAKPSELLQAPLSAWRPFLEKLQAALTEREQAIDSLSRAELRELRIHQALLAQVRGEWALVKAPVERARRLQEQESGKHLAGLLNELLAEQQLRRADSRWLRKTLRVRVLAMPWSEVGSGIRSLRDQLAGMSGDAVIQHASSRLDFSVSAAKGSVSLGFAMQLIAMRLQLLQVLPQRDALVQGLDDVLARREKPATAP